MSVYRVDEEGNVNVPAEADLSSKGFEVSLNDGRVEEISVGPGLAVDGKPLGVLGRRPWRTGRNVGRTLYDADERLLGLVDSPELAQQIVDAINGKSGR